MDSVTLFVMNKCYQCLYHAVPLTIIIIIFKKFPPGKATLYSHAGKDSASTEKLVSNFLPSGEYQAPDPVSFPDCQETRVTLEAQMQQLL